MYYIFNNFDQYHINSVNKILNPNHLMGLSGFTCIYARTKGEWFDRSDTLTRKDDNIIFKLLERAQYCYNSPTYDASQFPFPGFKWFLIEFMVKETERLHSKVRFWFFLLVFLTSGVSFLVPINCGNGYGYIPEEIQSKPMAYGI